MAVFIPSMDELRDLMARRKSKKLINGLIAHLNVKKETGIQEFYDLYGQLIKENLPFALNFCYNLFRSKASKLISAETLAEMDRYLLTNFALNEKEGLITSFKGEFQRPKAKLKGHVFLTDFRFLGTGMLSEKGKSATGMGPKSLLSLAVQMTREAQRNALKRALKNAMGDKFSDEALNIFQHHFPIINAYNIKKSNSSVSYTVLLKYEHKKKMKEKVMTFKVTPKSEKIDSAWASRRMQILDSIEETLIKAQTGEQ
jgi:hypothetical protein